MTKEELDRLWKDSKHWKANYAIYSCSEDPRVIVPKHIRWTGWTINFAHRLAYPVLAALFLAVILPVSAAAFVWPKTQAGIWAAVFIGCVDVFALCFIFSRSSGSQS